MKLLSFLVFILFCSVGYAQIVYDTIPINKQLLGRDIATNQGEIIINGNVNNSGVTYDSLKVNLYRDNILLDSVKKPLLYSSNLAPFDFKIPIVSELNNYKVEIIGKNAGVDVLIEETVDSIVAGDIYIINGQSNAVAEMQFGSANVNQDQYIRVYANASDPNDLVDLMNNDNWYIAQGDGDNDTNGNTGQWGLTLAKTLVGTTQIPVAIFNGAAGGLPISRFAKDFNSAFPNYYNIYQKLDYRLDKTGLRNKVRAVFWSQGESDGSTSPWGANTLANYKNEFTTLKNNWLSDYTNIEHIYIFQTRNGDCHGDLHLIKEAQRQVAFENSNISIMSTQGIGSDGCHFPFVNGYETFANRISPFVLRDLYGYTYTQEIQVPMITDAYMTSATNLVVETDATSLSFSSTAPADFKLENAAQTDITGTITSISATGNKITFNLSADPGPNATISYLGQTSDAPATNYVTNSSGLEIISFYQYLIDSIVLGIDDLESKKNLLVMNEEDALVLKSNTIIKHVKVYDITGRLLITQNPLDKEFRIDTQKIRKGTLLLLNVTFDNGSILNKKVIKI